MEYVLNIFNFTFDVFDFYNVRGFAVLIVQFLVSFVQITVHCTAPSTVECT